jgi:hypothetical protein
MQMIQFVSLSSVIQMKMIKAIYIVKACHVSLLSRQDNLSFYLLGPLRAVGQQDKGGPRGALLSDAIQFKEVIANQSNGGSFKLSLYASVKVFLIVISSITGNVRCLHQN